LAQAAAGSPVIGTIAACISALARRMAARGR
jgi:hypothetical protein